MIYKGWNLIEARTAKNTLKDTSILFAEIETTGFRTTFPSIATRYLTHAIYQGF
jgi:hypothetical protein